MHEMEELKEMLCDELEKITKQGKMTAGILDTVDKLTHSIKSIETIIAMDEEGYSNARGRSSYLVDRESSYARGGRGGRGGSSYEDSSYESYERGGGSSRDGGSSYRIRRDGRRDQRYNYSRGSYEGGYSRDLKNDLEDLMMETQNEEEKRMLKKWIKQLDD